MNANNYEQEKAEHLPALNAAYAALQSGRHSEAMTEFQQLAERGSATAWINLGWMYQSGSGVQRDLPRAQQCYERAVTAGSRMAMHYLASVYRVSGDLPHALQHYEKSAQLGCLPSIYWAGTMHLKGEGTLRDPKKALYYLSEAADRGHIFARRDRAIGFIQGVFGDRRIMRGISDWISSVLSGLLLARRDPGSERLM